MDESDDPKVSNDPIMAEARKRWKRSSEWESESRIRFIDDLKFRHGDSENGYQWPQSIRQARDTANKPCLTMNMINQHNLQISNEARKNKSSVKFLAMGGGATQDSALAFQDLMRRIEYESNAQAAYTMARGFQIDAGIGWLRLATDYVDDTTFNQHIKILPVLDPLAIYGDPDCQDETNLDARFGFAFDSVQREDFEDQYPKYAGKATLAPLGMGSIDEDWAGKDSVRVCEYFRKVVRPDQLVSFVYQGERKFVRKSMLAKPLLKLLDYPDTIVRDIWLEEIEWFLIVGEEVIDKTVWLGKYIPLIPVKGIETRIDGRLDRKGHTRFMKDAQRMYNYNASAQVEFVALQGKTPWVVALEAIEELEGIWNTANISNPSVLPFRSFMEDGTTQIPPPQRTQPPSASPAYASGMETAWNQMMMTSGQYQNQLGMMGNERTGAAIKGRQKQSDNATFHFEDNYGKSLMALGKQIIDLVPKVYDTKQVLQVVSEEGEEGELEVDPKAPQAYQELEDQRGNVVQRIFNPTMGRYDIAASVGPDYESGREETEDSLTTILTQAPALTSILGDLLLGTMKFPKAQEAARRMKRMVPPQALGKGPSQAEQQLQTQLQASQAALAKALSTLGKEKLKLTGKEQMRDIDTYEAETKRMTALQDMLPQDSEGLQQMIHQLVGDALQVHLGNVVSANADDLDEDGTNSAGGEASGAAGGGDAPPIPGATKAPDGEWYLTDPTRRGKYLRVGGLAQQK